MLTRTEIRLIAETVAEMIAVTDELLTAKSCAALLGISVGALHKRCERGQIPSHTKHGALYFSKNEVTKYFINDDTRRESLTNQDGQE